MATSEIPEKVPEITIKTELVIDPNFNNASKSRKRTATRKIFDAESEAEDELDKLLDHDSDDDPSWGPKASNKADKPRESDMLSNFQPKKRKRIGMF